MSAWQKVQVAGMRQHGGDKQMWHQKDKFSLSESFLGWLMGEDKSTQNLAKEARVIEVRLRVIQTLKQRGLAQGAPLLHRVAQAPGMEDLWYLRPDIMQSLSSLHGETQARSIMTSDITPLFAGSVSTQMLKPHRTPRAMHANR
jgi:hypothetical protein